MGETGEFIRTQTKGHPMNVRLPILSACACILLLVGVEGCGKSKASQCNAVIDKVNAYATDIKSVPPPKDDASARTYAEAMNKGAEAIKSVQVEDEKVKEFRDNYSKALISTATSIKTVADAVGDPSVEELEKMKVVAANVDTMRESFMTYCKE